MHDHTLSQLSSELQHASISSLELTQHFLQRVKQLDNRLNSFISIDEEAALAAAKAADQRLAAGNAPALCGIPIAHKDIFCTEGQLTTCGSKMLANFVPPYSATIVENFARDGAVNLGKLNMDEFAMGSSNESSHFGAVHNPWNLERVPGGSSGGSAAAVAARLVPAATASDTGGSIRQPASLCGLTGIKPSYGMASRWGMIAFASSLDQAGILARNAEDAALMLNSLLSFDEKDSTSIQRPAQDYRAELNLPLAGRRIGIPREYFGAGLDDQTGARVQTAIAQLESLGAIIVDISLPHTELAVPAYYVIAPAECSANLSRFDGVRYGHRCDDPRDLEDLYCRSRGEGFGNEVKRRILVGTYALSAGYYDAYYRRAQQVRRLIRQDFIEAFAAVDVIATPTTTGPAFALGEKSKDPVSMYREDVFTVPASLAGLPCMSLPCGFVNGLPVGLQLIGPDFSEARLLNLAHEFQQHSDHHQQCPEGY